MRPAWADMVLVGRVARAHGRHGGVLVNPETDFAEERFVAGRVLFVERGGAAVPVEILEARWHLGRPLLVLEGVAAMNDAEALAGAELRVPADDLAPLAPGTYYHHELVGCEVVAADGKVIGRVARVSGAGGASLLVVASDAGREVLVPLAADICVAVDVAARRIVVAPPDGLLDLNG